MRKPPTILLLVMIASLYLVTVGAKSYHSSYHTEAQQEHDQKGPIRNTYYRNDDEDQKEVAQLDVVSDDVPALPRMTSKQKWDLIRSSGQDPTIRRRNNKDRQKKVILGRGRRDLILAPWRIQNVAPRPAPVAVVKKTIMALPVDTCPTKFDAITKGSNGRTYVFARERVYQVWFEDGLPQKASFLISEFFPGGPRTVSAALTNSRSGVTILFNGRTAYRFRWNRKTKRFQLAKNSPQELPRNITITPSSAYEWSDGNQVVLNADHFVIYDAYWNLPTFTGHTKKYFPNLPRDLLGIIYNGGGNTLLMYTKSNKLKVYNTKKFKVVQEYPLKLNEFVGCLST